MKVKQFYKDRHSMPDKENFEDTMKRINREAFRDAVKQCLPIFIIVLFLIIYKTMC